MWSRRTSPRAFATFHRENKVNQGLANGCRILSRRPLLPLSRDPAGINDRLYYHHLSSNTPNKRNYNYYKSLCASFHIRTITTPTTTTRLHSKPTTTTTTMPASREANTQQRQGSSLHTQHLHESKQNYICPPETGPHIATILGYPSRCSTLRGLYGKTCREIVDLACTIAAFEPVRLHVRAEDQAQAQREVDQRMQGSSDLHKARISLVACATNHCWVRDTGPVYVRGVDDGRRYAVDFRFCEWGNKTGEISDDGYEDEGYEDDYDHDWAVMDAEARQENTAFAQCILELENRSLAQTHPPVTRIISPIRLEGGGIEIDGEGTFMATESSIIGAARNAGISQTEIEAALRRLLGIQKFIWFPGRIGLDITDCHVDAEARFVKPGVVVLARPHATADAVSWEMYDEMRSVLDTVTDARGRRFEVHDIADPDPACVERGRLLRGEEEMPAASYVNFYFVNGGLIVPAFGDGEADARAVNTLKMLLPDREIRQVSVNALPRTGGVLHCVTQQVL